MQHTGVMTTSNAENEHEHAKALMCKLILSTVA